MFDIMRVGREKFLKSITRLLSLRIDPIFPRTVGIDNNLVDPEKAIVYCHDEQRPKDHPKTKKPDGFSVDRYSDLIG
jgi:hypothetical protein